MTKIINGRFEKGDVFQEMAKAYIASIAEHSSAFFCLVAMIDAQFSWQLDLFTNIAPVIAPSTFFHILFQGNAVVPQKLIVLGFKIYCCLIIAVVVSLALLVELRVFFTPLLAPGTLSWPVVRMIACKPATFLAAKSGWLKGRTLKIGLTPRALIFDSLRSFVNSHYSNLSLSFVVVN